MVADDESINEAKAYKSGKSDESSCHPVDSTVNDVFRAVPAYGSQDTVPPTGFEFIIIVMDEVAA